MKLLFLEAYSGKKNEQQVIIEKFRQCFEVSVYGVTDTGSPNSRVSVLPSCALHLHFVPVIVCARCGHCIVKLNLVQLQNCFMFIHF
jgi:hypothetical protein